MAKIVYPGDAMPIDMKPGTVEIRHKPYHRKGRAVIANNNFLEGL